MGHRTEGLEKYARDVPEDRCFSIVFKNQRNTLDLIAPSPSDAQHWVQGLRKVIHHSGSMDQRQKLQQYPFGGSGSRPSVWPLTVVIAGAAWVQKIPSSGHHAKGARTGWLNSRDSFSHRSGGWKSAVGVPAGSGSGESFPPGFSLSPLCTERGGGGRRDGTASSLVSSYEGTNSIMIAPPCDLF